MPTQAAPWVEVPFQVQKTQDGLRVDQYLTQRLHRYSRAEVQNFILAGQVFLRGRLAKASARVAAGETVMVRYPRREETPCPHSSLPVLYEDTDFLAINKPGDVLSHPADKSLENAVTTIVKRQFPDLKLHLVHRLDRETSGILLLAKNAAMARRLSGLFAHHQAQKEYWAIVRGKVLWREKTVDAPIGREAHEIKVRQAVGSGFPALTQFKCLKADNEFSLVTAWPKTGRLHQIRVHLAYLGHPIVGDKLYLEDGAVYLKAVRKELQAEDLERLGAPRQMLHAAKLSFKHPKTGQHLQIEAEPPEDFQEKLRFFLMPSPALRERGRVREICSKV